MSATAKTSRLTAAERDRYAQEHAGLVKHIAARMAVTLPDHVETEDLLQEGMVGLLDALQRFDPSKGIKLKTFVATRIRGAMLDALRSRDFASRGARRRLREMHQAQEKLSHSMGRQPTTDELAENLDLSRDELERRRREGVVGFVSSLEERRAGSDSARWIDSLATEQPDVETQVDRETKKQLLKHGLKLLQERERLLLALYYFEDLNIREIAQVLEVSEARVSQLHGRALRKLRDYIGTTSIRALKKAL